MTINELKNNPNYEYHHTAARRGYISRKTEGYVEEYEGRYGKGYLIARPRWDTNNYIYIDYYLEK